MRTERGSAAIEMTLITPVLLMLLLLVVAGGRLTNARADVDAAARDGARSASIARNAAEARRLGEASATASLNSQGVACHLPKVAVNTADFRPGGTITVDINCDVDLSDVTLLPLPSVRSLDAHYSEVVDTYREVTS